MMIIIIIMWCRVQGLEVKGFLGCGVVLPSINLLNFRRNLGPPSLRYPEGGGTRPLRNVSKFIAGYTKSHSRRL